MRHRKTLLRTLAIPLIAVMAACGGGNEMPELDPDQALVRVEHDITNAPYITVAVEDANGNPVSLGNVERGTTSALVMLAPDVEHEVRLIAIKPGDDSRDDHIISEPFVAQGGMTINWYLPENTLEVSN